MVRELKQCSWSEFLELFDPSVHDRLRECARRDGVSHLVCFEVLDLWSSHLGQRTAMTVGPGCTYKDLDAVREGRLGDVPSRFQYPTVYVDVAEVKGE